MDMSDISMQSQQNMNDSSESSTEESSSEEDNSENVSVNDEEMEIVSQPDNQASDHVQQHLITTNTGRQFIAKVYRCGPNGIPEEVLSNNSSDGEGNVAQTLCFNFLNELAKGSSHLVKHKKRAEEKCSDRDSKGSADESAKLSNDDVGSQSVDHGESEPPYKKAKFGWQIKNSRKETDSDSEPDNEQSEQLVDSIESISEPHISSNIAQCTSSKDSQTKSNIPTDCHSSSADKMHSNPKSFKPTDKSCDSSKGISKLFSGTHSSSDNADSALKSDSLPEEESQQSHDNLQNFHIAKSLVDNAINRTLEDMGLSPDVRESEASQRQEVENVGVDEIIRERGLHREQGAGAIPDQRQRDPTRELNPIISRLTELSENIFVQNVQRGLRLSALIDLNTANVRNLGDETRNDERPENLSTQSITHEQTPVITDNQTAEEEINDEKENSACISTDQIVEKDLSSPNCVIDEALNAAINKHGLHYE